MKAHTTILEPVRPQATLGMIPGISAPPPPAILKRASESPKAAHADPQALLEDSANFREDIRRRHETPFRISLRAEDETNQPR